MKKTFIHEASYKAMGTSKKIQETYTMWDEYVEMVVDGKKEGVDDG